MLAALSRVITFKSLRERGIKTIFYGQIDNPLLAVCDPFPVSPPVLSPHAPHSASAQHPNAKESSFIF